MKRRAVYFLLCVCFCFYSLSSSYSAVEYDPYTGEEMIYDEADSSWYTPAAPLEFDPWSFFITSSPLYPEFDINKLPWLDMPTYVQEILYGQYSGIGADVSYTGEVKLPFVLVIVHSSVIRVVAGWNLFIGSYCSNADLAAAQTPSNVFVSARKVSDNIYKNAVCYQAKYRRSDYSLSEAWKPLDAVTVGDRYVRYSSIDFNTDSRDFYCYGFNTNILGSVSSVDKVNSDSDWSKVYVVNDPKVGFQSGKFVYWPDSWSNTYFSAFTPPTQEQLQNETSKGIWESIKSIPDLIGEKLKGLFIPADGFFDEYVAEFQEYFKDRFGLLYELPDSVVGILQQFVDYSPAESGYSIHFPEVVMPVLENGEWYDAVLIEESDITFDFLEQGAFKTLYSMYRSVVWLTFIFALINLIIRKSERVFGGGG